MEELYESTKYLINYTHHIYADIVKQAYLEEIEEVGDKVMAEKLRSLRDVTTLKSQLIMSCLKQHEQLVKYRVHELQEEDE